ncbi:hypothetical protein VE01_03147 [Pseudogymnoascus verrucosus]|uniref:fumarylacetoacetase n=1 Tax=Pseudogymnoascus verrucosus TaxID=342668 RepID=A0A1B8GRE1_9PEZI|nr:uncharacterized protein VE01_03147 [Pseudogymnoascus verrucosus]OBT98397.1 hypothetical protein VE01_03147 [Pseudogymnoascus verrucosus]
MSTAMFASHFSVCNIPFGIGSSEDHPRPSAVTRLENTVIYLDELAKHDLLSSLPNEALHAFSQVVLNDFAALPRSIHQQARAALQTLFKEPLTSFPAGSTAELKDVTMHLPVSSRDFTDFSCSKDHVLNAGEAILKKRYLPPAFLHFPIGYSGRTSSIIVSGTSFVRPKGQFRDGQGGIKYRPTEQLDYELELACIVGKPTKLGETVTSKDADDHIFGYVLMNDWSARDIQGLEMTPLGPLNGKSFATSMSPWIITLDALQASAIIGQPRELEVASYLVDPNPINSYDIALQADIITSGTSTTICKSNLNAMYWTFRDLVVHQSSNGCCLNTGDILGTGTISGSTDESHGCLLELTKGGQDSFEIGDGKSRVYIEDGDEIRISALASNGDQKYLSESRIQEILVGSLVPFTIASVTVVARFFTRIFLTRNWGTDDSWIAVAWIFETILIFLNCLLTRYGAGRHQDTITEEQYQKTLLLGFFTRLIYLLVLGITKIAICALFLRIFRSHKRGRYAVYGFMAFVGSYTTSVMFTSIFQCRPISKAWQVKSLGQCSNYLITLWVTAICNILCDVVLLLFIIPHIMSLKIDRGQKAALLAIVSLASLVIVAAIQ